MKFENITKDNNCDCLKKTFEDSKNIFTRKLRTNVVKKIDFESHWEKGLKPKKDTCKEICLLKGLSINMLNEESESNILKKYNQTFNINPRRKKYFCKFKFYKNSGKMKNTSKSGDKYHYTFYKSDDFNIDQVEIIEIKEIPINV